MDMTGAIAAELEAEDEATAASETALRPVFTIDCMPDSVVVEMAQPTARDPRTGTCPTIRHTYRALFADDLETLFDAIEQACSGHEGQRRKDVRRAAMLSAFCAVIVAVEGYGPEIDALPAAALRPFFEGKIVPPGAPPHKVALFRRALEAQIETSLTCYRGAQRPVGFFR